MCNVLNLCFLNKEKKITARNYLLLWSQVLGPTPSSAFLPDFLLSKSHHISSNNRSKITYFYALNVYLFIIFLQWTKEKGNYSPRKMLWLSKETLEVNEHKCKCHLYVCAFMYWSSTYKWLLEFANTWVQYRHSHNTVLYIKTCKLDSPLPLQTHFNKECAHLGA